MLNTIQYNTKVDGAVLKLRSQAPQNLFQNSFLSMQRHRVNVKYLNFPKSWRGSGLCPSSPKVEGASAPAAPPPLFPGLWFRLKAPVGRAGAEAVRTLGAGVAEPTQCVRLRAPGLYIILITT